VTRNIPPAGNTGDSTYRNTNPQFINDPGFNTVTFSNFSDYDFHINNASPLKTAGTDGTEIGIYGGPYPLSNLNGVANLPYIQYVRTSSPVVEKDGTLKVKVKAYKHE
jgi:hypothetical protein